jgi:4-amino-4-deoxy-L-arabinose transferase-like glycosyltransferase
VPLFFVLWFLTVFFFFSFSDTKRELYLIPLLPTVALLLGNFVNDLSHGKVSETNFHRWLVLGNFALVAVLGVALPVAAWFLRREAFWLTIPASLVLVAGGAVTVYFAHQHQPLRTLASIALMITLGMMSAVQWIFPYLETFKSRRSFAREINTVVPLAQPLYVYADTMNDFNFYLRRSVMPVLSSPADVEKLLTGAHTPYLLVKQRDWPKLSMIAPARILLSDSSANTGWNLVELKVPVSQSRRP